MYGCIPLNGVTRTNDSFPGVFPWAWPRRFIALVGHVALALSFHSLLNAATIVYDGFDYPAGTSLQGAGQSDYSWGTNRWILEPSRRSDWWVFPGSLSHPSVVPTGGHVAETNNTYGADYERKFLPFGLADGDSLWFGFLVKVTQSARWDFYFTSAGMNSNKFGVEGNGYAVQARLGVGYTGSTNQISLQQNVTHLIVGRFQNSTTGLDQLDLWVDPDITDIPQPGETNSPNHIVHFREHVLDPAAVDSVLLSDRSLGSLAFDELRAGTTWQDVVPTAVSRVVIDRINISGGVLSLDLSRLTPGKTTTIERVTRLSEPLTWEEVDQFVPATPTMTWSVSADGNTGFYRVSVKPGFGTSSPAPGSDGAP